MNYIYLELNFRKKGFQEFLGLNDIVKDVNLH